MHDAARNDPGLVAHVPRRSVPRRWLNHLNVIHTYDVGEENGALFLAMEYLEGKTLGHLATAITKTHAFVDVGMACHLVVELLEGLEYAHELCDFDGHTLGIVHRDVSPHNVFITFDGHVKVLDFGIAKTTSSESQTERGVLKGKARYMAPEQAAGEEVDRRADLFASGVLLWELLTGERLYRGETTQVLLQIVREDAPLVSSRRPDIDPELDAIVAGALARDPDARFPTAAKMANASSTSFLTRRGLAVRAGDVVSLLQSLFPGAREESRRRVDNWLEGQRDASTPQLLGLTEVGARISTSAIRPIPGRPPPGRALLGLGLFAIVAVLGATGFLLGRRTGHAPIPAPAPSAVAAARDDAVGTEAFHLALNSSPVESTIEWSGKPLGQTPLMVDLDPGPQVFVLKREGFHPATVVVTVTERMKGTTESRTVMMVPDDKDLSHPASAQSAPQAKVITTTGAAPALRRVSLAAAGSAENPYSAVAPSAQADTPTAAPRSLAGLGHDARRRTPRPPRPTHLARDRSGRAGAHACSCRHSRPLRIRRRGGRHALRPRTCRSPSSSPPSTRSIRARGARSRSRGDRDREVYDHDLGLARELSHHSRAPLHGQADPRRPLAAQVQPRPLQGESGRGAVRVQHPHRSPLKKTASTREPAPAFAIVSSAATMSFTLRPFRRVARRRMFFLRIGRAERRRPSTARRRTS